MSVIKKIIHLFMHNHMPENVQNQFREWCLREEDYEDKNNALWNEWENMEPSVPGNANSDEYRLKLHKLHREMDRRRPRVLTIGRKAVAAAAVVLGVLLTVEFFIVREVAREDTVCLVASDNGKGSFVLPDGTHVWLNAESRLEYTGKFISSGRRSVRLVGEAFFDVKKDTRPFEVEMGDLNIRVLGTRFNARHASYLHTQEVTLQSGSVEVLNKEGGQSAMLVPNQKFLYDSSTGSFEVTDVDSGNYSSWIGESLVFDNMSLGDIFTNLEHWYNICFHISPDVDLSERISFTLRPETLNETLRVIEHLTKVGCRHTDRYNVTVRNK